MSNPPPKYNPNDPTIYLPYKDFEAEITNSGGGSCHLCNLCQIEKGSDIRCRCTYTCARHTIDPTIVPVATTTSTGTNTMNSQS